MNLQIPSLLPRQQTRVCQELAKGFTVQEVARNLDLSVNTISTHLKRIRKKLGARSAIHVAVIWLRAHG